VIDLLSVCWIGKCQLPAAVERCSLQRSHRLQEARLKQVRKLKYLLNGLCDASGQRASHWPCGATNSNNQLQHCLWGSGLMIRAKTLFRLTTDNQTSQVDMNKRGSFAALARLCLTR
jgi:hypothetical protein